MANVRNVQSTVTIRVGAISLDGDLALAAPPDGSEAGGTVIFAHGSGSSRHSPRNQAVAAALQDAGMTTLLFDLLTSEEEAVDARTGELRFDIDLLASRLVGTVDQVAAWESTRGRSIGLFGASTGAAGALAAAASRPAVVRAVVSRGGRPDLVGSRLADVRAPTRLIVGGSDPEVERLNRQAAAHLGQAPHDLQIVPGAGHLFTEPGALEQVSRLATQWFLDHL